MTCHSRWRKLGWDDPLFCSNTVKKQKGTPFISDCCIGCIRWIQSQWNNQKRRGLLFAFTALMQSSPSLSREIKFCVRVVPQHATRGVFGPNQKIVLRNFTVGTHTKNILLNVVLRSITFPRQGRSSTRIQEIVLSMSDKTTCKVPASVKCYL